MSAAELLRRLHEAATPGPWRARYWQIVDRDGDKLGEAVDEDAALIATLRTLLPELLAVVEAADRLSGANGVRRVHDARDALNARAAELTEEDDRG